jgi:hypothetical protein
MKILLIAQEPPLSTTRVVTGNAIRLQQLTRCLASAGHELIQIWQDPDGDDAGQTFRTRDELRGLLLREQADVHLVSYWELLDLMPFESGVPLVLDFLAPRPLEQVFDDPAGLRADLRRLQVDLSKVDLLLVGNEAQKSMMMLSLLEAGLDLSQEAGVVVVPLAADPAGSPRSNPATDGWTLVSGGVDWPWRDSRRYWQVINDALDEVDGSSELVLFGGGYVLDGEEKTTGQHARVTPLLPYAEFSDWLLSHAHIGLELAEDNVERRMSQSFRSLEFLRHGLPLICNSWLPLAGLVRQYDAGWVVDRPGELPGLLREILSDPEQWRRKSAHALDLARERLNLASTSASLLDWLQSPHKAKRLPRQPDAPPALKVPPWKGRLVRMWKLSGFFRSVRPEADYSSPVFSLQRLLFRRRQRDGVVLISRGDLFPADHGAAVKIIETARGLSRLGMPVALVTDDRTSWWQLVDGELRQKKIPWWIRMLSPPEVVSKALHYSKDIPGNNAFLYLPLSDRSFFWRTLYVGGKVGAKILQAEFPAYVRPGIHARRILDAKLVLVQHNVEYQRIRSQVGELTEEQYQRYKAIEIACTPCRMGWIWNNSSYRHSPDCASVLTFRPTHRCWSTTAPFPIRPTSRRCRCLPANCCPAWNNSVWSVTFWPWAGNRPGKSPTPVSTWSAAWIKWGPGSKPRTSRWCPCSMAAAPE